MGEAALDDYELRHMDMDMDMVCRGGREDDRVMEWESGLPGADELTPLSQPLVPPGLAAAFRIPPEPGRTLLDVHRASAATVSRLRRAPSSSSAGSGSSSFAPFFQQQSQAAAAPAAAAGVGGGGGGGAAAAAAAAAAARGFVVVDGDVDEGGGDSIDVANTTTTGGTTTNGGTKRPRLVWTPQLHKRFVDVVAHLGIKNAVPKTIMQLMNVEGLTRENVASHLQKYRLYVKRMQGLSNEWPSPSDHIFASTPVPHSLVHEPQPQQVPAAAAAAAAMYRHVPVVPMGMGVAVGMVPMANHHHYHHQSNGGNGNGYGGGDPASTTYHHAQADK